MPRFYLHVCNGLGFAEDEEGEEHADLSAARESALKGLRDISASELQKGTLNLASFIEIEGENHELLMTVSFAEAVRVEETIACDDRPKRS